MLFLAVFVVVGSVPERPFDVNLTPFLQVLGTRLALLSPGHDGVPFGRLLFFTVRADPGVGRGKGESCHRLPVRGEACLRVFTEITYKTHFVYHSGFLSSTLPARLCFPFCLPDLVRQKVLCSSFTEIHQEQGPADIFPRADKNPVSWQYESGPLGADGHNRPYFV